MVEDLREMQEKQGFSENRIDKQEFVCLFLTVRFVMAIIIAVMTYGQPETHSHR